jgi:hypothetical protein
MGLAESNGFVTAIVLRQFLLDDVGMDRYTEVIGLGGDVR